jgi:hypothetical protein
MAADIQLTRNPSGGTNFGQSATDKISLYGVTPIVQRTSTVLATSLLSASSYVSVASNTAAIMLEMSKALIAFGLYVTA